MSILKKQRHLTGGEKERGIGFDLPIPTFSYLTMHVLAKGSSKSAIVRSLVETWVEKEKQTSSPYSLAMEIARKASYEWSIIKKNTYKASFTLYKMQLKKELIKSCIDSEQVTIILKNVIDGTDEKK
jgi:hypothetical protein